ncbi:hypothetical protein QR680_005835 [Steinernema hermaphroditum]|uniref:BZIP domain-containing protein n=1 Tax=Steinernema hermaphroditum TaxID=289476 RepID=A0AA39HTG7_9BILA|nr:hypothetical protein QR680_005835 [Steinernema hermaphroditum]
MAERPSVICGPRTSLPIKREVPQVDPDDDDQPQDLSMKTKPIDLRDFSLPKKEASPEVVTDVVTLDKRDSVSPTTPLTPMERISFAIQECAPSTSATPPAESSSPSPHLSLPEPQPRRRGRPRLPDTQIPDGDATNGDSKIFQKRLYARQYRERIKTQLDAKAELQRKLNDIRAQNELLQKEIDLLKQQNLAYREQQAIMNYPNGNMKNLTN